MEFLPQGNLFDYLNSYVTGSTLCSGGTFNKLFFSRHKLDWGEILSLARDVAEGMEHLHSHLPPIIHRDLKSSNVMVLFSPMLQFH